MTAVRNAQQAFLSFPRREVANLIVVDILTGARDELSAGSFVDLQYRRKRGRVSSKSWT
jgi:hypothetical protein